jgi:hypothetical protein
MMPPASHSVDPLRLVSLRAKSALGLVLSDTQGLAALATLTDTERLALQLAELERLEIELAKLHTKTERRALDKKKKGCLWEIDLIRADLDNTWYPRKQKRIEKASWRRSVREARARGIDLEEEIRRAERAVFSNFGGHEGSNDSVVARCMARVNDPLYMFKASLA